MRKPITHSLFLLAFSLPVISVQASQATLPLHSPWTIEATSAPAASNSQTLDEVTIKTEGRRVHISGAEDKTLEVYNIVGVKVTSYTIDAPEKTITLSVPRGIYILRVGKVARKVNIP